MEFDPQEWISAQSAAKTADVSLSWIRKLGQRGDIRILDTDLGRLYYKQDVQKIERQRRPSKPA